MKGNLYSSYLVTMRGTIYVLLIIFRGISRKGSQSSEPHLSCKISYVQFRLRDLTGFVCSGTFQAWSSFVFCSNRGLFDRTEAWKAWLALPAEGLPGWAAGSRASQRGWAVSRFGVFSWVIACSALQPTWWGSCGAAHTLHLLFSLSVLSSCPTGRLPSGL